MKKLLLAMLLFAFIVSGCAKKTQLFDGKSLKGWDLYLEDKAVDPLDVWSVKDGVIHCKGQPMGYMRTTGWYEDYMLHLEWRWVDKPSNSGVLLHISAADKLWPANIEAQLESGHAGDFWLIDGPGLSRDGKAYGGKPGGYANIKKRHPSNEKPLGEWNTYDVYCKGDTIKLYVNDLLQNEGTESTVSSGRIALQSEGAPIEFRNIYIRPLK